MQYHGGGSLKSTAYSFITILAALVMALGLASCAHTKEQKAEADALYKMGMSSLLSGNPNAAFAKFHQALKFDPDNTDIHNALGHANIMLADFQAAERNFKTAVEKDINNADAWKNLCYAQYLRADYKAAVNSCNKTLEIKTYETPEKAYYNLGRIYFKMKRYEDSIYNFEMAIKRYPTFFQAHYAMALTYNAMGKRAEAKKALTDAVDIDPALLGDKKLAEETFRKARAKAEDPKELNTYIEILHY